MKITFISIHNFRSIVDASILVSDYLILVGENNTGKTSIITALRMFWEDDKIKFNPEIDLPKFEGQDKESWIEIHFQTTQPEQESLKYEYRSPDNILKVRRYFHSSQRDLVHPNQSNIYAYEGGVLSTNLFYGAKNISQAKLGKVIFIPEVTKVDEALKLSGPSPFRQMVNFVMETAVQKSGSYGQLNTAFDTFNASFKEEASKSGFSVQTLVDEINADIEHWGIHFGIDVNPIEPEEIVKNLLTHYVEDRALDNARVNLSSYGQGLQRNLIYTLIRLAPKFADSTPPTRKEFNPEFTLILFEEPEAFLHPSQQERMNASLRILSKNTGTQVLVSTHSPHFVSKNIDYLSCLVRLDKSAARTSTFQISPEAINSLLSAAQSLRKVFSNLLSDPETDHTIKIKITRNNLADNISNPELAAQEEAIRYFLWLNPDRASLFFARHVIICEGQSDKALLDCLIDEYWPEIKERHVHIVDALGKYCIHRYMILLSAFGISHSVIMDRDNDQDIHNIVNGFIDEHRTQFTKDIYSFPVNIETFIGIDEPFRGDLKAVHLVSCLRQKKITSEKINELKKIVLSVLP